MRYNKNKNASVAGFATILLVAAALAMEAGATTESASKSSPAGGGKKLSSKSHGGHHKKAGEHSICSKTDYKDTCENSLAGTDSSDPKELIEAAVKYTISTFADVVKDSKLLKKAAKDKSTKAAFAVCKTVLGTAVDDLNRSASKISHLDSSNVGSYVEDLRVWLSAVITNQETCIDAFEKTKGDNGEKMKKLLVTTRELSSNALAMVSEVSSLVNYFGSIFSRRRLLADGSNLLSQNSPNAVVAQDGSGQFKTINEAIATVPIGNTSPFFIYVKAGEYKEHVEIPKGAHKIIMYGDGQYKTIVTDSLNFAAGTKTFQSSTLSVNADDFFAHDIGFHNTAGPEGHQAVAVRVSGDRAVFYNVNMFGYQDTLYTHTYRQFYRDCIISGTIDFIFGDALAIFQNCKFVVRKPMDNQACMVTAQGRIDPRSEGAIVIQNGIIEGEQALLDSPKPAISYLGRPWKELSRTIIMHTNITGIISPDGWSPWDGNFALDTLYYAEYMNVGDGAKTDNRVKWKGIQSITEDIAQSWTPGKAFLGDFWITGSGIPYAAASM